MNSYEEGYLKGKINGLENLVKELKRQLAEKEKEVVIWKEVARMACEDEYWSCPDPPERYNLQDEYGSDEPYWVQEGGCVFQDGCAECQMNAYYNKALEKYFDVKKVEVEDD